MKAHPLLLTPSFRGRTTKYVAVLGFGLSLALLGCDVLPALVPELEQKAKPKVDHAEVEAFQPAGDYGGGVLTPGTMFPPTHGGTSKLIRHANGVRYNIHTTGLPQGAYTVWIVTINEPENCATHPCTVADVLGNPDVDATVFWSDGGIVQANGVGNFKARIHKGVLPEGDGQIGWPGNGLLDPYGAEIHLIVKYHGLASSDPDVLYAQTHTLLGSCEEDANAKNGSLGVQCFDPQFAIHSP